jgi:hypothetical protein
VPRLDFGYALNPENSASAACINFQGNTVLNKFGSYFFEEKKNLISTKIKKTGN